MQLKSVVLPAPLEPSTARRSPGRTVSVTSVSAASAQLATAEGQVAAHLAQAAYLGAGELEGQGAFGRVGERAGLDDGGGLGLAAGLALRQGATYVIAAAPGNAEQGATPSPGPLELLHVEGRYAVYRVNPELLAHRQR